MISLFYTIRSSGSIGIIIIALGTLALVTICTRIVLIYRASLRLNKTHDRLISGELPALDDSWMSESYLKALNNRNLGLAEFRRILGHQTKLLLVPQLTWGRSLVGTIAASATSLGLLGTVCGISNSFLALSAGGSSEQMAAAIQFALQTTILGLAVSIPLVLLLVLHAYVSSKVRVSVELFADSLAEQTFPVLFKIPAKSSARVNTKTSAKASSHSAKQQFTEFEPQV